MRISARNQLKGSVTKVTKGATTSHVLVDIGNGQSLTSSITTRVWTTLASRPVARML
jgi:molybdopterin-binding protein